MSTTRLAAADTPAGALFTVELYLPVAGLGAGLRERLQRELQESHVSYQLETAEVISLDRVLMDGSVEVRSLRPQLWISWSETATDIYLRDRQKDRVYVRRLLARGRDESVRQEELVELVRSLAEALAEGAEIGVRTSEVKRLPTPPPRASAPPPKAPPTWRPGAYFSYELGADSNEIPVRHGVALGGALFFVSEKIRLGVGFQAGFSPASFQAGPLSTELDRWTLRPFARLESSLGKGFSWSIFLGPGTDLISLSASSESSSYEVLPARWLSFGVVRAGLGLVYRTPGFALGVSPMCDFSLVRQEYQLATSSGSSTLSEPLMVRPQLGLEIWPLEGLWP